MVMPVLGGTKQRSAIVTPLPPCPIIEYNPLRMCMCIHINITANTIIPQEEYESWSFDGSHHLLSFSMQF